MKIAKINSTQKFVGLQYICYVNMLFTKNSVAHPIILNFLFGQKQFLTF